MKTDWKALFEELLLAVEDARRDFDDLDSVALDFDLNLLARSPRAPSSSR